METSRVRLPEGFRLVEDDDHLVRLLCGEVEVRVFSATGANPREIEKEAERYLLHQGPR